jgi:hypothetical protein
MLLTAIGVLAILGVAEHIYRARLPGRVKQANLGWMSAQWLAQYRASNPS